MMRQLPVPQSYAEQYTITLGDVDVVLLWRWRPRLVMWTLDISAPDGTPMLSGRLVTCGVDLLRGVIGRPSVGALVVYREVDPQQTPDVSWSGTAPYFVS